MSCRTSWALLAPWMMVACVESLAPPGPAPFERQGVTVYVDDDATGVMDGSQAHPYRAIGQAVDDLDARGGGTVVVAAGDYALDASIRIDSALALVGAGADQTTISASAAFTDEGPLLRPLIQAGCNDTRDGTCPPARPGGTLPAVLNDVTISGFTMQPGSGRNAIVLSRVQGFRIEDNVVTGGGIQVFMTASSGVVTDNAFSGATLAVGIHAGYRGLPGEEDLASPSHVFVTDNTIQDIQTEGVMLFGSTTTLPQWGDELKGHVQRNVFHTSEWGAIRVVGILRPIAFPGTAQGRGQVKVTLSDNEMIDIPVPFVFDAGMPYRRETIADVFDFSPTSPCSTRWYTADLAITIEGGSISNPEVPLEVPVDISFTRPFGDSRSDWQYLHLATYDITGDDALLAAARINHPEFDTYQDLPPDPPELDACRDARQYDLIGGPRNHPGTPLVATPTTIAPTLGNTLLFNGVAMPYSRTEESGVACSGPGPTCVPSCHDGEDNDLDGDFDEDDPDCHDTCSDQADNDGDGLYDGADPTCHGTCGEALNCAGACIAIAAIFPNFDVPKCVLQDCPVGHDPRGPAFAFLPICDLATGGDATQAYFASIQCGLLSGCAGNLDCLIAACGPIFGACQTTPCHEVP